jgi:Fe-S-cluster containining protein
MLQRLYAKRKAMKKKPTHAPRSTKREVADSLRVTGADLDARREQRLHTVAILNAGRTPLQIVEIGANAADRAESAVAAAVRRQPPRPPSACTSGCDWCCHQRVGVAAPEVMRIVDYLKQNHPAQQLEQIQVALRQPAARGHPRAHTPCPLLVNNHCSVYPVRPLTCRGFNSSDPQACQAAVTDSKRIDVPVYAPQLRLTSMVLDGMRAGLKEAGLESELLELTAALHIALSVPDAETRWLAGQPVFASARLP